MSEETNLTGRWTGVYFYPVDPEVNPDDELPPTPFTAELEDVGGMVTGTTLEPDVFGGAGEPPIPATLEGHRLDRGLTFTKFPNGGGQIHSIDYIGSISGDGNSISGQWIIHGEWSGTFHMHRKIAPASASRQVDTAVEL